MSNAPERHLRWQGSVAIVRDGPRRHESWTTDMRRVRDSAFPSRPFSLIERLSPRRRRQRANRYPHLLTRRQCWTVRAVVGGAVVGYAWGYLIDDSDPTRFYIDDVAVHEQHQARGIGTALIDELVDWLQSRGVTTVAGYPIDRRMAKIFARRGIRPWAPGG